MKNAMLLSLRNSDFTEMFRLARAMKDSGRLAPVILTYTQAGNDIVYQSQMCEAHGIELFIAREPSVRTQSIVPRMMKSKTKAAFTERHPIFKRPIRIVDGIYRNIARIIVYVFVFLKQFLQFRSLIKRFNPAILVLAEDIVGLTLPTFIRMGHWYKIPSVIVPYTIANASEAAESLYEYPDLQLRGLRRVIGRLFPRWVYTYKGATILRLPTYFILAHQLFGLTPPDPWVMNSGYANAIAVENPHMKKYYLNEGFFDHKLVATGAIYDDTLAAALHDREARRAKLYQDLGLPADKPLIVIGAPPNQMVTSRPVDFKTYEEALDSVARPLAKLLDRYHVVVRPHPNYMIVAEHFAKHGITHTVVDTAELIPLCDLYIAAASATIRWAIACGVPAINYDLFQYRYADYAEAPGVVTVYEPKEYEDILMRLTSDPAYFNEVRQSQQQSMTEWGNTDGQSAKRMLDLMDSLIGQNKIDRTPTTPVRKRA